MRFAAGYRYVASLEIPSGPLSVCWEPAPGEHGLGIARVQLSDGVNLTFGVGISIIRPLTLNVALVRHTSYVRRIRWDLLVSRA